MAVNKDPDEMRNWMAERWHEYAKKFSVITPDEQPAPDIWGLSCRDMMIRESFIPMP